MPELHRVLLTGATGFIGRHVHPTLLDAGFEVVPASRDPERAQREQPGRVFTYLDVSDRSSTLAAMRGCDAAVYLVHGMGERGDYEAREQRAAQLFAAAAQGAGLSRIVYLGGPLPLGATSKHLRSRLRTGEILRAGRVPTIELQATMVIGVGSESWRIVRDLAARLPLMLLPRWLENRSQPIAIEDVAIAIREALRLELPQSAHYPLPGPQTLSAREIVIQTARLLGHEPVVWTVPVMSPGLSSMWISLVTRADRRIARQLVFGLCSDLVAPDDGFWKLVRGHKRLDFAEAARRALAAEIPQLSLPSRLVEDLVDRITRRAKPAKQRLAAGKSGSANL